MNNLSEKVLARITQLRIQKDISEKQMSRDIGKTSAYLSSLANNKSIPSLRSLATICDYLEISLKDFFSFDEIPYPMIINEIRSELLQMDAEQLDILLQLTKNMNRNSGK